MDEIERFDEDLAREHPGRRIAHQPQDAGTTPGDFRRVQTEVHSRDESIFLRYAGAPDPRS